MRVVALYRVSTEKQENEGASLAAQQRRYREMAASSGWTTVAEFRGQESAAKAASERVVLQQILACLRVEAVDAVWVYEQSRLTRGDELEVAALTRELRERGIRVIVLGSILDLEDPDDTLRFGLSSIFDRREWQKLRERAARGRREKALQGRKTGGPTPYGYLNPPAGHPQRGTLQPHPEHAAVVRRIFEATAAGASGNEVADALNREGIPSPRGGRWLHSTVGKIIRNPVYAGTQFLGAWQKGEDRRSYARDMTNPRAVVVDGAHEPLVAPELAVAARAQRASLPTGQPGVLSGLLWIDGRRVVKDGSGARKFYRPAEGRGPWVPVETVNGLVWDGFCGLVGQRRALAALLRRAAGAGSGAALNGQIGDLAARRDRLDAKLGRLVDMRAGGEIRRDVFLAKSDEVRRQLAELAETEAALRRRAVAVRSGYHERSVRAAAVLIRTALSERHRRRVLRALVGRVDVELAAAKPLERGERGRLVGTGAKWAPGAIYLHLNRYPGPDPTGWDSVRTLVAVQIVRGGLLVPPAEAIRAARRVA